jgi:hypothetical protein
VKNEETLDLLTSISESNKSTNSNSDRRTGLEKGKLAEALMNGAQFIGPIGFEVALQIWQGKSFKIGEVILNRANLEEGKILCPCCKNFSGHEKSKGFGEPSWPVKLLTDSDGKHFASLFGRTVLLLSKDGTPIFVSNSGPEGCWNKYFWPAHKQVKNEAKLLTAFPKMVTR